jgi:RND family efflux transporter MFP subunit
MRNLLMMAGCLFAVLLAGCRAPIPKSEAASEPPAVAATLVPVQPETFQAIVPLTGTLVSNARVDIKAETIGRVVRFDKEEGDRVAAGEAVVWVNDENYRLAVRQAESAVKVAEAAVERARLLEQHSRSELDRAENLVKSGGITDKDLKAARLAEQDSKAQVTVVDAQLDQARSALEVARKHLRDAVIHAPVAGVIQKKFVNAGAYVEAPTALFTVVDNSRLELESPVAAADLAPVQSGQRVVFTVNSFPSQRFEGRVVEVAPAVDAESRSAKVRVQVPNAGGRLKAGMFAEGEILTGANARAIVIPAAAVYRDDRSASAAYVFVAVDGKASRRTVRVGRERDGKLEILDGLNAGDTLIAEQSIEIAEGVRVRPRT